MPTDPALMQSAYERTVTLVELLMDAAPGLSRIEEKQEFEGLDLDLRITVGQHRLELEVAATSPDIGVYRMYTLQALRGYRALRKQRVGGERMFVKRERFSFSPKTKLFINTCPKQSVRTYRPFREFIEIAFGSGRDRDTMMRYPQIVRHLNSIKNLPDRVATGDYSGSVRD